MEGSKKIDLHLDRPVHRMIAAPTGGGKSFFVGMMVEELYRHKKPFIVLDTKTDNHRGLVALHDVKHLNINPKKPLKNLKRLDEYPYILCTPEHRDIDIEDILNMYREIIRYMWRSEQDRVFVIEEAHNYNKNASVPDALFERIAREGRGYGKLAWFVTQRLQNFSQLLWSQCTYTYLFRFIIPSDIRYCASMVPGFDVRKKEGLPGWNSELDDHDVLVWDGRAAEIYRADSIAAMRKTKHMG